MNCPEGESKENVDSSFNNPADFLEAFKKSPEYASALNRRFEELNCPESDEDKRALIMQHFPGREDYKEALWLFREKFPLVFTPEVYSDEFIGRLEEYWSFIRDNMKEIGRSGKDLPGADSVRMSLHRQAAEQLAGEGLCDFSTARLIVHFLSIDQGLDVPDPARDEKRLAAEASRIIEEERGN